MVRYQGIWGFSFFNSMTILRSLNAYCPHNSLRLSCKPYSSLCDAMEQNKTLKISLIMGCVQRSIECLALSAFLTWMSGSHREFDRSERQDSKADNLPQEAYLINIQPCSSRIMQSSQPIHLCQALPYFPNDFYRRIGSRGQRTRQLHQHYQEGSTFCKLHWSSDQFRLFRG